eukprot:c16787_g2_i3.p1 GENE.c16787_g2_i3~~c16787_g2_i3.p1  ORF type:complete len:156 (-),score=35.78 c16787_g2_i3:235-702(-)
MSKPLRCLECLSLPKRTLPQPSSSEEQIDDLGTPLVLVVEDNPMNTKIACKILHRLGCETLEATNGLLAVSAVFTERPKPIDLVLMDINMPVLDGLQACAQIRARGASVPVIACTAHVVEDVRLKCESVGMNGAIQKPLRTADLKEILRTFIKAT